MTGDFPMITLKTKIISQTGKAVLLEVLSDESSRLTGYQIWVPKSQLYFCDTEMTISINEWLYDEKLNDLFLKSNNSPQPQRRNKHDSEPNNRSNNTNQTNQERNSA
jgi:hypothetical protein